MSPAAHRVTGLIAATRTMAELEDVVRRIATVGDTRERGQLWHEAEYRRRTLLEGEGGATGQPPIQ